MVVLYNAASAEEVPTGGLNWIKEQVVTHQAGKRKEEIHGELIRDQLSTQVVFMAAGDVPYPLLSLETGFPPAPEHWTVMTVSE